MTLRRTAIRRVSPKARDRRTAWTAFRREVWERDAGRCVICGIPMPLPFAEIHHRLLKSRGGKDTHENTLTLCGACHHERVHKFPSWATCVGFMVPRGFTPLQWPVLLDVSRAGWDVTGSMLWQVGTADGWTATAPHPDQLAVPGPWQVPGV